VPPSGKVAGEILTALEPDNQRATEFLTRLQAERLPASYPYPLGASRLTNILKTISTEIEFGRATPAAGATEFISAARKALGG
jgi:multiple sugar transport system substrate-binding protein